MLKPKEITLNEKELFFNCIGKSENSTLSFTTLFTWSFDGRIRYDLVDDCLVLVFCGKNNCLCTFPYGDGDKISALKKTYDYMKKASVPTFALLSEEQTKVINEVFPGEFDFFADENNADYVYLTEDLINLKGKKYQQKETT